MTRERIDALEADKARLMVEVASLRAKVDRLGPENARLVEALASARSNANIAAILIAVGGGVLGYASYVGQAARQWANAGILCLVVGVIVLCGESVRRRAHATGAP